MIRVGLTSLCALVALTGLARIAETADAPPIEQQLGALLTNGDLARLCHFREAHFVRLFRQHLRPTPAQYILERRIAAAPHQLAFPTDSIEQIAERLGFAKRYHFSKLFTRRMSASPAAYRKQTRV